MDLYKILIKAQIVKEQYDLYALNGHEPPHSIEDYLFYISELEGVHITRETLDEAQIDWRSHQIKGCLLRFEDETGKHAEIYVAPEKSDTNPEGITLCEKRFITLKEASHIAIDTPDSYTDLCIKLVEEILYPTPYIHQLSEANQSEQFAPIFAMELLFPWGLREGLRNRILDPSDKLQPIDVARNFKIPLRQLTWILSENVHTELSKVHETLGLMKK